MQDPKFVGRNQEVKLLSDLTYKKTASLVAITGRRRIGKSRLIEEFTKNYKCFSFSGLAPEKKINAQRQRNEFSIQLSQQTKLPAVEANDWSKLFLLLADKIKTGRVILVFDEITWMAEGDGNFLSKLKNAWDNSFKKNDKLIFVVCGSYSAWIEENIIRSTGYFGRISLHLNLTPLNLTQSSELLNTLGFKRSPLEKLTFLALSGGIPWYIEQVIPHLSAAENIGRLCFHKSALLLHEIKHIFHDLFSRRSHMYEKIVHILAKGPKTYDELSKQLNYSKSSSLTNYLTDLKICGYLARDDRWNINNVKEAKQSKYRLNDNFLRFYFRAMAGNETVIENTLDYKKTIVDMPGGWGLIGLQIENLILNNHLIIFQALNIEPNDIVHAGAYFQQKTKKNKGCQIDYLIQTKLKTIFVIEIRFSQNPITTNIFKELQNKITVLTIPKGFATLPVLIHCNKVSNSVTERDFFYRIINICDYM